MVSPAPSLAATMFYTSIQRTLLSTYHVPDILLDVGSFGVKKKSLSLLLRALQTKKIICLIGYWSCHFFSISLNPTILCYNCLQFRLTSLIIHILFPLQVPFFPSIPQMLVCSHTLYFVFLSLCCPYSPSVISYALSWWLIVVLLTKISPLHSKPIYFQFAGHLFFFHQIFYSSATGTPYLHQSLAVSPDAPPFTPYVQPWQFFFSLSFLKFISSPIFH